MLGSAGNELLEEDRTAFQPMFATVQESDTAPPNCDVLVVYLQLDSEGHVVGCADGLRDIIQKSGAQIAIVGSDNQPGRYVAGGKRTGYPPVNLAMTLQRKGAAFSRFFAQLFDRMSRGSTMLLAWVELAPQRPGAAHENCPEIIFVAEISHIVFQ